MADALEIVVRLGDTTLEHRFEALGTPVDGIDPARLGRDWTSIRRGLAETFVRHADAPIRHPIASTLGDRRVLGYTAISLAAHLALWGVSLTAAPLAQDRAPLATPPPARFATAIPSSGSALAELGDAAAPSMKLAPSGASERPRAASITKAEAIERARAAGLLGSAVLDQLGPPASIDVGSLSTPVFGEGFGFGRQVAAHGPCGVGCGDADGGLIGTGRYATIGRGEPWDHVEGTGPARTRHPILPTLRMCSGPVSCVVTGGLDKALVRRYIRRELPKLQYCYEKQLLAHPELEGTVATHLRIEVDGHVSTSEAAGVSTDVAGCVAGVLQRIQFPRSKEGATDVRYPFMFRASGW